MNTDVLKENQAPAPLNFQGDAERLLRLFNGVPALISHWDRNLINLAANDLYIKYFGKKPSELLGTKFQDMLGPNFKLVEGHVKGVLDGHRQQFEIEIVLPDGNCRYFQATYHPDIANGKVQGFFALAIDMTERVETNFRFEQMANAIQEVIWMTDQSKDQIIYISPGYEIVWGRTCQSLYENSKSFIDAIHPEDQARVIAAISRQDRGDYNETYRVIRPDGTIRWVRGRAYVVKMGRGQVTRLVGVAHDITDETNARAALDFEKAKSMQSAKLASLGELSAGIAHEINNPLAVISGNIALLSRFKDDPEKFAAKIKSISKSADRIAKIVNGLRKFSRSNLNTIFQSCSVLDIAREALVLAEGKAKRAGVKLSLEAVTTQVILCDHQEIEQVLINLINNAIDAVKTQQEKWVTVQLFDEGEEVVIRVKDSGLGIDPAVQAKMFQPFFTTKPIGEGTGLGLSITKGILEMHKASISLIQDDPNTCFELRFARHQEK